MSQKVVICGAGFLGSSIAKVLLDGTSHYPQRRVCLLSRQPSVSQASVTSILPADKAQRLDSPIAVDITKPHTLLPAFKDADVVISLVGIMHGKPEDFEQVQWKGAQSVAQAARDVGAKLIHISAIGADTSSHIPYARTKGFGEQAVLELCPDVTIIRPSIVFGPGDGFFGRFAKLSKVLPFMPVFGGGRSLFQPVYVEDIARGIEVLVRGDQGIQRALAGRIIEAGGPDVFTYRQIIELVLKYTGRWRPIISLPYSVGTLQGLVLEQLPPNLFTLTRTQVEQLKQDNIVNTSPPPNHYPFDQLVKKYAESSKLTSVYEILPSYLPYL